MKYLRHRSPSLSGLVCAAVMLLVSTHAYADNVKVFLLGGQSNMAGLGDTVDLPTSPVNLQEPQDDVLFYCNSTLTTLRPGYGYQTTQFGPEITFGRTIADNSPSVQYALIKYAAAGTALYNDWAPTTGPQYTAFRNTVTAGIAALQAAGHTTEIVGMLWHQGESDAIEGQQNNYQTNLTNFIADMRSNYGTNLPFLIGEIRRSNANLITVADAQIAVAAADPYAIFVPAADLVFQDAYHFDTASQMILGQRFAQGYIETFLYPDAPSVDAGVDMITWSGQPVQLDPNIVNNDGGDPQAALIYAWAADPDTGVVFSATDVESPTVTITKATDNPSVVTLTLVVNNVGRTDPDVTDTMTIDVYDTACKATIGVGLAENNPTDVNLDCITDLQDLAEMAQKWLLDHAVNTAFPKT
jgi:hypothetical protein